MPHRLPRVGKLISLSDHNAAIVNSVTDPFTNEPRPNGIACEKCGKELVDIAPNAVCAFAPLRKAVRCPACGWIGDRLC